MVSRRSSTDKGNYAIGLKDHTIFPEIPAAEAGKIFGMQIQLTTTAKNDEEGRALLKELGMPFAPERPKKTSGSPGSPHPKGSLSIEKEELVVDVKVDSKDTKPPKSPSKP